MTADASPISFGLWDSPGTEFPIRYSLPLLREIDSFVADGYRRIPHGGLEVGGLLYGTMETDGLTLLHYQPIECQHLYGPRFVLSEADVEGLRLHVGRPFHHESLGELTLAGWIISRGRGDLKLMEREIELFDELFPSPRQVTMLVKPEKFKPTRYGFLVRPRWSRLIDPVCHESFILPLTARPGEQLVGAAPVSVRSTPTGPSGKDQVEALPAAPKEAAPEKTLPPLPKAVKFAVRVQDDSPSGITSAPIAETVAPAEPEMANNSMKQWQPVVENAADTVDGVKTPAQVEATLPIASEKAKPAVSEEIGPDIAGAVPGQPPPATTEAAALSEMQVTETPARRGQPAPKTGTKLVLTLAGGDDFVPFGARRGRVETSVDGGLARGAHKSRRIPLWLELAPGTALILVCIAGVLWTYLNYLLPPIPLRLDVRAGSTVVTWPPEVTHGSEATLTIWTGGQSSERMLTKDEQRSGSVMPANLGADSIVQLRTHHWAYNRAGQIRLVQVPPVEPPAARPPAPLAAPAHGVAPRPKRRVVKVSPRPVN